MEAESRQWVGTSAIKGQKEWVQMALLTISVAGLQFTWGVEMAYVNIYLRGLGMSKPMLSVVWVAGPLSGLLMQPVIGVLSDNSTSKYGRRRPYIIGGSITVSLALMTMAWAKEIVGIIPLLSESIAKFITLFLAVIAVLVTDFAVNAVQACCRALIVDVLPADKQEQGNAWAGRMIAIGHLISYYAGYLDLVSLTGGFLGDTQLKSLCIVASASLLGCVGVTSWAVSERVSLARVNVGTNTVWKTPRDIAVKLYSTVRMVPPRIFLIFRIQFCAWYGWFTFLFYSSQWVSEVYIKYSYTDEDVGASDKDQVGNLARVGSMALTVFSFVSLICSLLLPELVSRRSKLKRMLRTIARKFVYSDVTLTELWLSSHVIYAFCAFSTGFVRSLFQATALVALCGFSWAVTTWAPFALLAEEIHLLQQDHTYELGTVEQSMDVHQFPAGDPDGIAREGEGSEESGVYLGIHNVAVTLPQLFSTFVSFLIFSVFQVSAPSEENLPKPGEGDGGRVIAFTLQVGAIPTLLAAYYTYKLGTARKET